MLEHTVTLLRRLVGIHPGEADRRTCERHPTDLEIACRPAGDSALCLSGRIRNISLGGIRLVVDRRFDPGDLLDVELPDLDGRPPHTVLACVVHVLPLSHGEWSLGCNFSCELTDADLAAVAACRRRGWPRFPADVCR